MLLWTLNSQVSTITQLSTSQAVTVYLVEICGVNLLGCPLWQSTQVFSKIRVYRITKPVAIVTQRSVVHRLYTVLVGMLCCPQSIKFRFTSSWTTQLIMWLSWWWLGAIRSWSQFGKSERGGIGGRTVGSWSRWGWWLLALKSRWNPQPQSTVIVCWKKYRVRVLLLWY